MIAILFAAGADPDIREDEVRTALDGALWNEALRDSDVIEPLEVATAR